MYASASDHNYNGCLAMMSAKSWDNLDQVERIAANHSLIKVDSGIDTGCIDTPVANTGLFRCGNKVVSLRRFNSLGCRFLCFCEHQ